jgi:hypothetical protein
VKAHGQVVAAREATAKERASQATGEIINPAIFQTNCSLERVSSIVFVFLFLFYFLEFL